MPALARAEEEPAPTRWYGWQIMIADGAVLLTNRELGTLLAAKRASGGWP